MACVLLSVLLPLNFYDSPSSLGALAGGSNDSSPLVREELT